MSADDRPGGELPEPGSSPRFDLMYRELRGIAHRAMSRQPPGHTLQTTALLHEAWLRLDRADPDAWQSEDHFLAVAASAMRSVLVDHARRRRAEKRGGDRQRIALDSLVDELQEAGKARREWTVIVRWGVEVIMCSSAQAFKRARDQKSEATLSRALLLHQHERHSLRVVQDGSLSQSWFRPREPRIRGLSFLRSAWKEDTETG